jgi:hypothetical protein
VCVAIQAVIAIIALASDIDWKTFMGSITKALGVYAPLALIAIMSATSPASAISVDLARKCRAVAIKAYPPAAPGTKKGSAAAERGSYQNCIQKNGNGSNEDTQKNATPSAK